MKEKAIKEEEGNAASIYNAAFEENGETHAGVRWASKEGQELRFQILSEIGDLNGATILDVGCGFGHFGEWLACKGIKVSYTGLDITGRLLDQARLRIPEGTFIEASILGDEIKDQKFDYVIASGLFADYPKGGIHWMTQVITRLWSLSTKGVAFNSLSLWTNDREANEFHADPGETINYCSSLTKWVVMRHDYHPRDFTIFMKHEKAG